METLIIQVDCRPYLRDGPPQLGITVEAPFSKHKAIQQQQQQQHRRQPASTKESYQSHDYQNLDNLDNFNLIGINGGSSKASSRSQTNHEGLQITKIQPGSVIDRIGQFKIGDIIVECNGVNLQRPFAEAQRALKQFVVGHTSHGPLVMKVLRKAASSSSIQSTTGSQITVIEKENNYSKDSLQKAPINSISKPNIMSQQVKPSASKTQTSPKSLSSSVRTSRHLVDALNTRRIGVKHTIRLKKSEGGFGIKIVERDNMHGTKNKPIYIKAITPDGSAYKDGRLQEGDMLLEVNGYDLQGKSQSQVTEMLKAVRIGQEVKFVVSRQELDDDSGEAQSCAKNSIENDCDKSLIDLDVPEHDDSVFESSNQQFEKKIDSLLNIPIRDGPGIYVYDIPLNDTKSAGLGLYLKYPRRADGRKDLGIWIKNVITGGAAWKDGRLQPDDQILAINGIDLTDLSNAEASEKLTAAVCRSIGPEATPNTIRLQIHRRDPMVVSKILQGTNNQNIECPDIITNNRDGILATFDKNVNNSRDSYQTANENTAQNRTSDFTDLSESSNLNSQSDSAMSPQTQASNSIKLTNSYNGRSEHNSSDKTNDTTSSAVSQITNSPTNVPIDNSSSNKLYEQSCDSHLATQPKSIHMDINSDLQAVDCTLSSLSLDDDGTDATGEERFKRSGLSRQSMSEKRHAQLTDTFRRNQRLREEREKRGLLEEQLANQRLDDDRRRSHQRPVESHRTPVSCTTNGFKSIYGLQPRGERLVADENIVGTYHREVPVDVHLPIEPKIEIEPFNNHQTSRQVYNDGEIRHESGNMMIAPTRISHMQSMICPRCGLNCPCLCDTANRINMQHQIYGQRQDYQFKRSNSLDSIQQHPTREDLIVPRAGTVRVARNRKVNESFRAAVDRSYEICANDTSSRQDHSELSDHRRFSMGTKMSGSIANSTASTANEERYLISNKNVAASTATAPPKKSSSLLTKFLKFGSIKRKKKNRNPEEPPKQAEIKSSTSKSSRDSGRSHSSRNSHARTHSSQSHPNLNNHQCENLAMKSDAMLNGQISNPSLEQTVFTPTNLMGNQHQHDTLEMCPHPQRSSLYMCQQQQHPHQQCQPIHDNNTQYNKVPTYQSSIPMTMLSKQPQNMAMVTRPHISNNNSVGHLQQQCSHLPLQPINQQQQPQHLPVTGTAGPMLMNGLGQDHGHYSTGRVPMILSPQHATRPLPNTDNYHHQQQRSWQSSHFQAPNGLWVINSPASDNYVHQGNNLYGTIAHHQDLPSMPMHTPTMMHHQQQQHHHPLQQQIYYYDF